MEERWQAGYEDAKVALGEPRVFELPHVTEGARIFDVHRGWATKQGPPPSGWQDFFANLVFAECGLIFPKAGGGSQFDEDQSLAKHSATS